MKSKRETSYARSTGALALLLAMNRSLQLTLGIAGDLTALDPTLEHEVDRFAARLIEAQKMITDAHAVVADRITLLDAEGEDDA